MSDNGHAMDYNVRLDRIEGILETLVVSHQDFQKEHRQLLTAQVVLTDRVDTLAKSVAELREAQKEARPVPTSA